MAKKPPTKKASVAAQVTAKAAKKASVKAAPAKKTAAGVPPPKAGKPAGRRGAKDASVPFAGKLVIGKDGRLSLRNGKVEVALEDLAQMGQATLTLQVDLRKRELLATGNQADLLQALADFLELRATAGIDGSVTTCKDDTC